jgi:Pectate lyase superfamily protein
MKRLLSALLLCLPTAILAQDGVGVSILAFGADATGQSDVSDALNRAIAASAHIVVPPGKYLLSGKTTVSLANVYLDCQGTAASANTPPAYGSTGATFLLTSTTVQPFTVAAGVRIRNCNFFWPKQTGASVAPIVYPPLFTEPSGSQMTNFDLIDARIINAYDVINAANTKDAFGAINLTDTQGYAVHAWFNLANVPETVTIKGMITDTSFYQNVANTGNAFLAKYTARNGTFLHSFGNGNGTTGSTVSVQGLLFSGSVFGYARFIWVDSTGALAESSFQGIVDAVPRAIEVDGGGCMANVRIDAIYYSYEWRGNGADNAPAFSIDHAPASICSSAGIDIRGQMVRSQGDVIDLTGNGIGTVSVQLTGNGVFAKSSTAGPYYFANIDSMSASFSAIGNFIQPPKASVNYRGFLIQNCRLCTIEANQFNGIYNPISISRTSIPVVGSGNVSTASTIGSSIVGTGIYSHRLQMQNNSWDALLAPVPVACGANPSVAGNDQAGRLTVGEGTITSCTLKFAQSYAPATPNCSFSATVNAYLYISEVTPSAITIDSSANLAGGSIYYNCTV